MRLDRASLNKELRHVRGMMAIFTTRIIALSAHDKNYHVDELERAKKELQRLRKQERNILKGLGEYEPNTRYFTPGDTATPPRKKRGWKDRDFTLKPHGRSK